MRPHTGIPPGRSKSHEPAYGVPLVALHVHGLTEAEELIEHGLTSPVERVFEVGVFSQIPEFARARALFPRVRATSVAR